MLLREALLDPLLSAYNVVIVDEAHERTVHTDVLLGLLKGVAQRRAASFRLIVMSATLDEARFVEYFGNARAAYVQGRQFPVQVLILVQFIPLTLNFIAILYSYNFAQRTALESPQYVVKKPKTSLG